MVTELTDEVVADHTVVVITSHDVMNKPDMIRWNEFCRGFTIDSTNGTKFRNTVCIPVSSLSGQPVSPFNFKSPH